MTLKIQLLIISTTFTLMSCKPTNDLKDVGNNSHDLKADSVIVTESRSSKPKKMERNKQAIFNKSDYIDIEGKLVRVSEPVLDSK